MKTLEDKTYRWASTVTLVQRPWLDDAVNTWLQDKAQRTLCLVGGPGTGKSTYVNMFVEQVANAANVIAFDGAVFLHQCRAQDDASLSPLRFVEELSGKLAGIPAFAEALLKLPSTKQEFTGTATVREAKDATVAGIYIKSLTLNAPSARSAFDRLIRRPCEQVYQDGQASEILIIVDALDEALSFGNHENIAQLLLPLLSSEERMPAAVRWLFTFRSNEPRLDAFKKAPCIDLNEYATNTSDDIHRYFTARGSESAKNLLSAAARRSGGNFLYARHILDAIEDKNVNINLSELPESLTQIFQDFLERELLGDIEKWLTLYQPVMGLLAVARGQGLTSQQLQGALQCTQSDLQRALLLCRQYLEAPSASGPFRFFHLAFREFLLEGAEPKVDAGWANATLCEYFFNEYEKDWQSDKADYARAHILDYIIEASKFAGSRALNFNFSNMGAKVLGDARFIQTRLAEVGPASLLASIGRWRQSCDQDLISENQRTRIWMIEEVIRLSGFILAGAPEQFASQAWARIPRDSEIAKKLLDDIEQTSQSMWLKPRIVCATPIGTPLKWTYDGRIYVYAIAMSEIAGRLALGNESGEVIVYDLEDGAELKTILPQFERAYISCGALHPDGKTAIFGLSCVGDRGGVLAVDLLTMEILWFCSREAGVENISISSDGTFAAVSNWEESLFLLDCATGDVLRTVPNRPSTAVVLSDNKTLAMGSNRGLWLWQIGKRKPTSAPWWRGNVEVLQPLDGSRFALGNKKGEVFIADVAKQNCLKLGSHKSVIEALTWDGGSTLFSGARDGSICAWDIQKQKRLWGFTGHSMRVNTLTMSGDTLYSGSKDSTAKAWDLSAITDNSPGLIFENRLIESLSISNDGEVIAFSDKDDNLSLQATRLPTGDDISKTWKAHRGKIRTIAFNDTSDRIISIGEDGFLKIWQIKPEVSLDKRIYLNKDIKVDGAKINSRISIALVWDYSKGAKVIRWNEAKPLQKIPVTSISSPAVFINNGTQAIVRSSDTGLVVIDLSTGEVVRTLRKPPSEIDDFDQNMRLEMEDSIRQMDITVDESILAIAKWYGHIELWDLKNNRIFTQAPAHFAHVHGLTLSGESNIGISVGLEDRELRVWSLSDGKLLCRYVSEGGWWSCAASEDGSIIVASDDNGLLCIFDLIRPAQHKSDHETGDKMRLD
jgi:WD40 repeat protein